MDIDNLLRYMAVHVFSVNEDSLTGSMAHNYYLYESGGQLNLIPWDYNLALGGMGGSDAGSVVNSAVDDAFSATDFFDTLMSDETYYAQYYAYLRQLVEEYITGGAFDAFYTRVRSQIDTLVETDPTAFYSYDEYLTAVDTLYQVVKLRGESIQGQLDGTIPSTDAEQRSSDALIDASALDLSVMGTMNTGGPSEQAGRFERPNADAAADTGAAPEGEDAQQPESGNEDSSAALQAELDGESADAQPRGGPGALRIAGNERMPARCLGSSRPRSARQCFWDQQRLLCCTADGRTDPQSPPEGTYLPERGASAKAALFSRKTQLFSALLLTASLL